MKNIKLHSSILGPSGCLREGAFADYFQQKLSVDETRMFELHLSECLLCSDAFDGFAKQGNAPQAASNISLLKNEIQKTYSTSVVAISKKKNNKRYIITGLSVAASLIILVVSYYLIQFQTNNAAKEMAIETPKIGDKRAPTAIDKLEEQSKDTPSEEKITITTQEETKSETKNSKGMASAEGKKEDLKTPIADVTDAKDAEDDKNYKSTPQRAGDVIGGTKGEQKYDNIAVGQSTNVTTINPTSGYVNNGIVADEISTEKNIQLQEVTVMGKKVRNKADKNRAVTKAAAQTGPTTTTINSAISFYDASEYDKSIATCNTLIDGETDVNTALYYLGMSYYKNNQTDMAIAQFDKLIQQKDNSFYELALWQKALILIDRNNKTQALELLNLIVKHGGAMKDNAVKKIEELNK